MPREAGMQRAHRPCMCTFCLINDKLMCFSSFDVLATLRGRYREQQLPLLRKWNRGAPVATQGQSRGSDSKTACRGHASGPRASLQGGFAHGHWEEVNARRRVFPPGPRPCQTGSRAVGFHGQSDEHITEEGSEDEAGFEHTTWKGQGISDTEVRMRKHDGWEEK